MVKGEFPHTLPVATVTKSGTLGRPYFRLSRTLERRFAEQQLLNQVTAQANAGLLVDEILDQLYASFRGLIPYHRIGLALLEDEGASCAPGGEDPIAQRIYLKSGFSACMEGAVCKPFSNGNSREFSMTWKSICIPIRTQFPRPRGERGSSFQPDLSTGGDRHTVGFLFFFQASRRTRTVMHTSICLCKLPISYRRSWKKSPALRRICNASTWNCGRRMIGLSFSLRTMR